MWRDGREGWHAASHTSAFYASSPFASMQDNVTDFSDTATDSAVAEVPWIPGWDYCITEGAFASELREMARKSSTELLLTADETREDGGTAPSRWGRGA